MRRVRPASAADRDLTPLDQACPVCECLLYETPHGIEYCTSCGWTTGDGVPDT